ncbi:MAG TPA: TOMM precursor leader peptide-binding protein [Longimicrobium sp.]|uniref:TOMM precursor leader peptide-binding protein n=1 Tax=Longimicrobium sp. TaxID=2029185 RepID=UPI002EDB8160
MERPLLTAAGRAVALGAAVVVESEHGATFFDGPGVSRLLPLLDGSRTVEALERELPGVPVRALLAGLRRGGHVTGAGDAPGIARGALGVAAGVDRVALHTVGLAAEVPQAFAGALARLGVVVDAAASPAVVLTGHYLRRELAAVNARRLGTPWLLARPCGRTLMIGPVFGRDGGPCWECLAHRLRLRSPLRGWMDARRAGAAAPAAVLEIGVQLAAVETLRLLGGAAGAGDSLISFDLGTMSASRHPVTRRPQCRACGVPLEPARTPPPVRPRATVPALRLPGGIRTVEAHGTLARLRSSIDAVTGVVGEPRESSPEGEALAFSYVAEHAFAPPGDTVEALRRRLALRAGGKGATRDEARASAVCEAVERYCGTYQGDEPARRAPYAEVDAWAIHPHDLLLFSARQYATREAWNRTARPNQRVPLPFSEQVPVEWRPAWSLTHHRERLVPASYCLYGHPQAEHPGFARADSNGCAAGNCVEEAALQGLLELVERDAVAVWWFNRLQRPGVDVRSFGVPYADAWVERYDALGCRSWVLDLTHDLAVPVFAAAAVRPGGEIVYGFGAHLDADIALVRALTEVNQSLPRTPAAAFPPPGARPCAWRERARIDSLPWLAPSGEEPCVRGCFGAAPPGDVGIQLSRATGALAARGLEVLVVDQSRPDVDLAVVKVMVPGLRHFWRRLAPGRLYSVPVALGWLERELSPAELNEWDIYF